MIKLGRFNRIALVVSLVCFLVGIVLSIIELVRSSGTESLGWVNLGLAVLASLGLTNLLVRSRSR